MEFLQNIVIKVLAFFGYEPYVEVNDKNVKIVWIRNWAFNWKEIRKHILFKIKHGKVHTSRMLYKRLPTYKVYRQPGSYFKNIENMTFFIKIPNINKAVKDSYRKKLYYQKIGYIDSHITQEEKKTFYMRDTEKVKEPLNETSDNGKKEATK